MTGALKGSALRRGHIEGFLLDRGIAYERLGAIAENRTGAAKHVLLTSSPVQGLANASSDIDLIRIQESPLSVPRMATQIFEDGHHLEVISFGSDEVSQALADLRELAGRAPAELIAGLEGWDRAHEVRTKYLERIVNGVAQDWSLPYADSHGDLAVVWMWGSLHRALKQILFLRWAEAAGETRGRLGYAVNAVLYLMDAILSGDGDVYSNRKWFLLRWSRWLAADPGREHDAAAHLEQVRAAVMAAAREPDYAAELTPIFRALVHDVLETLAGVEEPPLRARVSGAQVRHPFLPGAEMLLKGSVAIPVTGGGELTFETHACDPAEIAPARARELLSAARAGLLFLDLGGAA
ncbi:DUF6001 family protein [Amycolatopsis sp. NPDC059657]|uniref:DUF6001 family protein n=1 Tax=Amycolatopsis sp. NPDC059657 TaxID=3346899 RepID=UPI003671ADAF